jgi:hypothetical protein
LNFISKRTPRDYITPDDHFYFVDFERHHAEIAAYHVDRILGFNRVPPTVGRLFDITKDLWEKAEPDLEKTFFYSPVNNTVNINIYCNLPSLGHSSNAEYLEFYLLKQL